MARGSMVGPPQHAQHDSAPPLNMTRPPPHREHNPNPNPNPNPNVVLSREHTGRVSMWLGLRLGLGLGLALGLGFELGLGLELALGLELGLELRLELGSGLGGSIPKGSNQRATGSV